MEKINLNKKKRLENIMWMALKIQDTKLKSLREIRSIAESIEIMADTKILTGINKSIDDLKQGKYIALSNLKI